MVDAPSLVRQIRTTATALGFDLIGITRPSQTSHHDVYRAWIGAGRHGEMSYLAAPRALDVRADPRRLFAQCRSLLVLATRYLPQIEPEPAAWRVDIARYALGSDYHDVLVGRLRQLVKSVERQAGGPIGHRIYTDTGPLLERELAQQAGLGWIGRNTCLIHPRLGSYLLLSEVLLDLPLPADPPMAFDRCGSCRRCIDACPTGCILSDRTLDARRCISYLTIELRGRIPTDLRPSLGSWAFGCDICQQVCPWNTRFAVPTQDTAFQPRTFLRSATSADLLQLTPEQVQRRLHGSPLKRARRTGLVRNAAIVAGNLRDVTAIPSLIRSLVAEEEPWLREAAAWALGRFGHEAARKGLVEALAGENDESVLYAIRQALASA